MSFLTLTLLPLESCVNICGLDSQKRIIIFRKLWKFCLVRMLLAVSDGESPLRGALHLPGFD